MLGFTVRRFLSLILVLIGISLLTFLLSRAVPTDVARLIAGPRASAEGVETIRRLYGLDLPLPVQFLNYMKGVARLDFGISYVTSRPVLRDISEFLGATLELTISALIFALVGGLTIGISSALWQNRFIDHLGRLIAIIGLSMPAFWLALIGQLVLYQKFDLLPFGGRISDGVVLPPRLTGLLILDSLAAGRLDVFKDAARHLILPMVIVGLEPLAVFARVMRNSLIEVLRDQYIVTARAKGLTERLVIWRHAIRNALLPVLTMVGLEIGWLLSGAVLVETVLSWPGVGRYAARSISALDYNPVMGITLVMAFIFIFVNYLVDALYAVLDPRIKMK
jgi:peptide/nickel transport system permease protein